MTPSVKSTPGRGYTIALISAAVLSTTAVFIRHLTQTYLIPALVLAFWRDIFVVVTLVIILKIFRPSQLKINLKFIPFMVCYGLILAIFNAFWTLSVSLNGAAISTVLAYTSGGFTALLGRLLLKENLGWLKIGAVGISITGCILASEALDGSQWTANPVGILTGVCSGLAYAAYSLMGRSAAQRGIKPWTTLLYTFGFASFFLWIINLTPGSSIPGAAAAPGDFFWLGREFKGWLILFLLAAGPTLTGFGLYNVSLDYLPSSVANLILTTELVFTVLMAYVLLGETLKTIQIVGSLLILTSVVMVRLSEQKTASQSLFVDG